MKAVSESLRLFFVYIKKVSIFTTSKQVLIKISAMIELEDTSGKVVYVNPIHVCSLEGHGITNNKVVDKTAIKMAGGHVKYVFGSPKEIHGKLSKSKPKRLNLP